MCDECKNMPTKGLTRAQIAYWRKVIHNLELNKNGDYRNKEIQNQADFEQNNIICCGGTTELEDLQADMDCQHGKKSDPCCSFDSHVSLFRDE